jgi:protein ImuB
MRAMLERLAERLSMRALVAGDITLAFGMSGHRSFSRRIAVAAPSNDVRAILTLINLSLEAAPPEDGVESIRIEIAPRVPRPAQTDMFLPPCPAPDKLQTTIARLAALCGPGNVGMLSAENSHRPEAMRLDPFAPPAAPPIPENAAARNVTQLVIRAIRPAREIEVMCSREIPEFVRGENLGARVISIAGPWRRDGEWWLGFTVDADMHADSSAEKNPAVPECGFIRDYYELALEDGGVYRIFRDLNSDKWFLDGAYD